jgi:hypothetical protein
MSIIRLNKHYFQTVKLQANPPRAFSSSSAGITGSVALFADASSGVKDLRPTYGESSGSVDVKDIDLFRNQIVEDAARLGTVYTSSDTSGGTYRLAGALETYLDQVTSASVPIRSSKRQEILRFVPGVKYDRNFVSKKVVQNMLFPYYRNIYPTAQWSYTNYNCLNFVTGGNNLPKSSVLIYPAGTGTLVDENKNPYGAATGFTFDFYINPRYTTENPGEEYTPGTIMHMSSCYALSLVSGSSIGRDGKPDAFRMLLQLSSSANIPPSKCLISGDTISTSLSGEDTGFAFVSSDNSLLKNKWHHVAVRWGGPSVNNGTGSFVIDKTTDREFAVPSSSVMQVTSSGVSLLDPDALFLGNFYEGPNYSASAIALFFNSRASRDEGVINFGEYLPSNDPTGYAFRHPLNAEIHDVKLFNRYRLYDDIVKTSQTGSELSTDLLFYVPPFFTRDTRKRRVLQTPFFDVTGSTEDPFNVALSFGVGGFSINLENFTREFVTNQFPRLLNLTASTITTQVQTPRTANYLLYESGSSIKRNITLTPCDNGKFFPNYDLIKTRPVQGISNASSGTVSAVQFSSSFDASYVDDFGQKDYSIVSLRNMVDATNLVSASIPTRVPDPDSPTGFENEGSLLQPLQGATPEDPGIAPGVILTVLQRQQDASSNEVVFFDISNMFYGDKIQPGTVVVEDLNVSGTNGRMTFKFRDNENGNLYRADALTEHAKWASVGNVLYEEGIIVIKTPHAPFFGQDSFKITFAGERSVYVLEMSIPVNTSDFNSSSNPTYRELAPSDYVNETAERFTYITGINLHDNNLNVIGRANLAQPVIKREDDKFVIKLRMDF